MIYFFCGAHKNASHFQRFVVEEALKQKGLPYTICGNEIFHRRAHRRAKQLLAQLDAVSSRTFLCKGHWGSPKERNILLSFGTVKIFLIWRHLLDVMISSFHYENNMHGRDYVTFDEFYRDVGRILFIQQLFYRRTWKPFVNRENVYETSFEALKENFEAEAARMLDFAGLTDVLLPELRSAMSLDRMRKLRNDPEGKFFRKGEPGEYKTFAFSQLVRDDMHRLENLQPSRLAAELKARQIRFHARRQVVRFTPSAERRQSIAR